MATKQELLQELDQEARATRRVLERVPEGRLDWRPHARSLTLGQLAMHVASLPGAIAELATRDAFQVGTEIPRPGASSTAELLDTLDRSVASAKARLGGMDDAALASPWRMMKGEREVMAIPRAALLRSVMLNHWYHHRGQLTVYLRQTGAAVPAIYGDSADERSFPLDDAPVAAAT
jgi:uncharacterized damage-inducible protein DinB